jgi:hypothetical protein
LRTICNKMGLLQTVRNGLIAKNALISASSSLPAGGLAAFLAHFWLTRNSPCSCQGLSASPSPRACTGSSQADLPSAWRRGSRDFACPNIPYRPLDCQFRRRTKIGSRNCWQFCRCCKSANDPHCPQNPFSRIKFYQSMLSSLNKFPKNLNILPIHPYRIIECQRRIIISPDHQLHLWSAFG